MATERWFLKVDGIPGESVDAAHKGEIDVDAWSWGLSNSGGFGGYGGGGGAGGKTSFQDFQFVTRVNAASPLLFLACAKGTHIKEARLGGVRSGGLGKSTEFLSYVLGDVTVASAGHGDSTGDVPRDQFALAYGTVRMTYVPQAAAGKLGTPITTGWDVKANKQI